LTTYVSLNDVKPEQHCIKDFHDLKVCIRISNHILNIISRREDTRKPSIKMLYVIIDHNMDFSVVEILNAMLLRLYILMRDVLCQLKHLFERKMS
jgi:hypothetical protein